MYLWWGKHLAFDTTTHLIKMLIIRQFSSMSSVYQRPNHALYPKVDWSLVDAGNYAVVDPIDTHAILYLSEKEYKLQVRVSLSQDSSLVVLARPGDRPVSSESNNASHPSDSQNTPPLPLDFTRKNAKVWRKFLSWHLSNLSALGKAKRKDASAKASVSLSTDVLRLLIPYWGLDLHFRLGGEITPPRALTSALRDMANRMALVLRACGPQYLIKLLKNSLFILNKYCAGHPADNPWLLGDIPVGLSRSGLPRILPVFFRRQVVQTVSGQTKDLFSLRLINSILNGFRAMEGTHDEQDLDSIMGAHPELDETTLREFQEFCKQDFWKVMFENIPASQRKRLENPEEFFLIKENDPVYIPTRAGPNASFALFGAPFDAYAWTKARINYPMLWCSHIGDTRTPAVFRECIDNFGDEITTYLTDADDCVSQLHLGKVQCLPEPAGKVRTIAIVDYWTQRLMSPVHDWMMKILSHQPTDGTFNQEEAVESIARVFSLSHKHKKAYSIDLKSATDMIPIALYRAVFDGIWRSDTVNLWIGFLTDRWFHVPQKEKLVKPHLRGCSIRYGRGQPMGTLSSWPSMALVHHALELFAAKKAGYDPSLFTEYRVLGDDNITLGADVAKSYVQQAKALCVPTSDHKTIDGDLFIFAQQIYLRGENISPLSLKEELGISSYSQRLELAMRAIRRGWLDNGLTVPRFLRLLLSRADYISQHREWGVGRLGKIAQSALVSAFGISSSKLCELLGFRGSGMKPMMEALKGRPEALAGDQGGKDKPSHSRDLRDLERGLAVRTAAALVKNLRDLHSDLEVAAIRYRMWHDSIYDSGFMPYATWVPARPKGGGPSLPGITCTPTRHLSAEELTLLMQSGKCPPMPRESENSRAPVEISKFIRKAGSFRYFLPKEGGDQALFGETNEAAHRALWPAIRDSYKSLFGVVTSDTLRAEGVDYTPDYSDVVAEEEEYGGMGMSFTPEPDLTPTPAGWAITTPTIVGKVATATSQADALMQRLIRDESLPAPWLELDELATILAKSKRVPDFTSLGALRKSIEVRQDELKVWVKRANILTNVLSLIPQATDFTVPTQAEMPVGPPTMEELATQLEEQGVELPTETNLGLLTK